MGHNQPIAVSPAIPHRFSYVLAILPDSVIGTNRAGRHENLGPFLHSANIYIDSEVSDSKIWNHQSNCSKNELLESIDDELISAHYNF